MKQRSQRNSVGQEGRACRDLNADGHPAQTLVTLTLESRAVRGFKNQEPVMADKEPLGSCLLTWATARTAHIPRCWTCSHVVTTAGPLPHTCSLQAAAAPAQPLHKAHCFGATPQAPEIQRNLLGMHSVEMKLLQLTEAALEIVLCCSDSSADGHSCCSPGRRIQCLASCSS